MVPTFLLSILARDYPKMLRASFLAEYPEPWLVWEPGSWAPATRTALHDRTVPQDKQPPRRAEATIAVAMQLQLPEGRDTLLFGRDPAGDLCVNDVTLSRTHLHFTKRGDAWFVTDPGSMNGTKVRGIPLPLGAEAPLHDQVEIDAGDVVLTFTESATLFKRMHREES